MIGVYDGDDQIVASMSGLVGRLRTSDPQLTMTGITKYTAVNGTITVNETVFKKTANTEASIEFIPDMIASAVLTSGWYDTITLDTENGPTTNVTFENCSLGQELASGVCKTCPINFYTLESAAPCKTCPHTVAYCGGSTNLTLVPGYWRKNATTDDYYKCLAFEACPGGLDAW